MRRMNRLLPGPVAVGGVGGSGTRVGAQLMQALGVYIGGDLNGALDNLWFTLLFKRPRWYSELEGKAREEQVRQALTIFEKAMTRGLHGELSGPEKRFIKRAARDRPPLPRDATGYPRPGSLLSSCAPEDGYVGWGWKEPNTHIFLRQLCAYFPELRYVHVIRNGLDMAFSGNQQQLKNWGSFAGITPPGSSRDLPRASLSFWVWANRKAIADARALLGGRFHLVLLEELCADPRRHTAELARFLGAPSNGELEELAGLVESPPTLGRFREQDLSALDPRDVEAVGELGFDTGEGPPERRA